jgi:hypothetical protein
MATEKPSMDSQEKQPLHKSSGGPIDAGKSPDGSETSIIKPSREMHTVKPSYGNEAPGQTTKM